MKLKLYLLPEGAEALALGRTLYTWNYALREESSDAPDNSLPLGEVEFDLPAPAECVQPVLAKLARREAEIQAEAYKEVREIKERRANLLSLTYTMPEAKESEL